MKKRSFVYWGMFFILLSTLITPFLKLETGYAQTEPTSTSETNQISATPNVVPRKQVGNIVTAIQLTDKEGNPLGTINQYTDIYLRIEFNLPDNTVNSGDTSVITLPEELRLEKNMTFNVVDDTGAVVAIAQTDVANKTVTLTYTDYVENHANISGSLYFTSLIDFENVKNESKIPIYVTVEGEKIFAGDLDYQGEGDDVNEKFSKYSWFIEDDPTEIYNVLRINPTGQTYTDLEVEDVLKTASLSYIKDTMKIERGQWTLDGNAIWQFTPEEDITGQLAVQYGPGDRNFSVHFGNIGTNEYRITYKTKIDHLPEKGETFTNYAKLTENQTVVEEVEVSRVSQTGGGEANGEQYVVEIHKEDEAGQRLAGAEFELIRNSTNQTVAKITTDQNGTAIVKGLLKDNYTLVETKAPTGYQLSQNKISITPEDFGKNLVALKTVVNHKISYQSVAASFLAGKVLLGKPLKDAEFQFELLDEKGTVLETVSNDTLGKIQFSPLTFETPGNYQYTIREVNTQQAGVSYDTHNLQVQVTVEALLGNLVATTQYDGGQVFTNHYTPEEPIESTTPPTSGTTDTTTNSTTETTSITIEKQAIRNKELPKTGETKENAFLFLGSLLLIQGLFIYFKTKK
ncbi:Ig-like domain-containing protein [Enterococcus faecalis]|uniref:Ig-like domain-containing protein n=1 Tax=Enterococcus faecalis TaxID=1351 RepID=UPI00094E655D|nr:Ig-like domain-containing protein [Enterococcus faecalis]